MGKQVTRHFYESLPNDTIEHYYNSMRQFWYPVLPVIDLPDRQLRGVELLEEKILLARLNGEVVAMQDICRHFQAKLSLGEVRYIEGVGDSVSCPYHGWSYDSTGRCVEIPQLVVGGREIAKDIRIPSYLVQEQHGLIWVCLEKESRYDIPAFPEINDKKFRTGPLRSYQPWIAAVPRIIMRALDDTHFPWVHEGFLGDRSHVETPDLHVWRDRQYLITEYTILQPSHLGTLEKPLGTALQEVTYTNYVSIPNVIRLVKRTIDGFCYVIWLATCPRRHNLTDTYWRISRNYDLHPGRDQDYESFEDQVRDQDRAIVESQCPWLLPPFWMKIEMPLRPADLPLIEYQKWLEEFGIMIMI